MSIKVCLTVLFLFSCLKSSRFRSLLSAHTNQSFSSCCAASRLGPLVGPARQHEPQQLHIQLLRQALVLVPTKTQHKRRRRPQPPFIRLRLLLLLLLPLLLPLLLVLLVLLLVLLLLLLLLRLLLLLLWLPLLTTTVRRALSLPARLCRGRRDAAVAATAVVPTATDGAEVGWWRKRLASTRFGRGRGALGLVI